MIWAAKWVLVAGLTFALCADGLDCFGMTTAEPSMACCKTMHCHSRRGHHSHSSQDCCDTTPQMHPALGQPLSCQGAPFSAVTVRVVQPHTVSATQPLTDRFIVGRSHDPPLSSGIAATILRI